MECHAPRSLTFRLQILRRPLSPGSLPDHREKSRYSTVGRCSGEGVPDTSWSIRSMRPASCAAVPQGVEPARRLRLQGCPELLLPAPCSTQTVAEPY